MSEDRHIIGIDFGSHYSTVAVIRGVSVDVIPIDGDDRLPNVVSFTDYGPIVGKEAIERWRLNTKNTVVGVRHLLGRRYDDAEVQEAMVWSSVQLSEGSKGDLYFEIMCYGKEETLRPEEVCALIFGKIKKAAEEFLGAEVTEAVVTVPSESITSQRSAVVRAARMAGLTVRRLLEERDAVGLTYLRQMESTDDFVNVVACDIGNSIEASILRFYQGDFGRHKTVSAKVGGSLFDRKLLDYCIERLEVLTGIRLRPKTRAFQMLMRRCEEAKCALSTEEKAQISIDLPDSSLEISVTRSLYEKLNEEVFKQCLKSLDSLLAKPNEQTKVINDYVLLGQSTKTPKLRSLLCDFFLKRGIRQVTISPNAVAHGAAIQADVIRSLGGRPHTKYPIYATVRVHHCDKATEYNQRLLLKRNAGLPVKTSWDNVWFPPNVSLVSEIWEGEHSGCRYNSLATTSLTGAHLFNQNPDVGHVISVDADGKLEGDVWAFGRSTRVSARVVVCQNPQSDGNGTAITNSYLSHRLNATHRSLVMAYCCVIEKLMLEDGTRAYLASQGLDETMQNIRETIKEVRSAAMDLNYSAIHIRLHDLCTPIIDSLHQSDDWLTLRPHPYIAKPALTNDFRCDKAITTTTEGSATSVEEPSDLCHSVLTHLCEISSHYKTNRNQSQAV